ncbi:MAG TPA: PQQ-dependent sugar dehydrogenase [Methylomirabilota bacterium]|nr:PQQ-dependent sugar dehydrogenase [Methylomirabilota bacterium]
MKVRALLSVLVAVALLPASLFAQRQGNATLRMPLDPPSREFIAENAFPGLSFQNPVAITSPAGDQRLFIIERPGRIYVITNLSAPTKTLFLDISHRVDSDYQGNGSEGLTSIAFHPNFRSNRQIFLTYSGLNRLSGEVHRFNRLSRFEISTSNPNAALADSEAILFTQADEGYGHNVNEAIFGPDGYLYVSVGDEGDGLGKGDEFNNSQRIDNDFYSGILRLDVDQKPDSLLPNPHPGNPQNYRIPRDNPWVGVTSFLGRAIDPAKLRAEFWAIGLRNPWKMSFDPATGNLLLGEVGLHSVEEINLIVKGGNYGWAYRQGDLTGPLGTPPAGTQLNPPVHQYPYDWVNGQCVIGGITYRGTRIPELHGAYIFADYALGNIWGLWLDGQQAQRVAKLNTIPYPGISGFGADPRNGDVLIADHERGQILRVNPGNAQGSALPATLADTGIFQDLNSLTPHAGILPYEINSPLWSDNAHKKRWFSVPSVTDKITFSKDGNWSFPLGTVWVKHFDLEMTKGNPATTRRLETRVLVKGRSGFYGVTYKWNGANAELVGPDGAEETFTIKDGNISRTQKWRYPSRGECLACHTTASGGAIGFNTAQLNREIQRSNRAVSQLHDLNALGYFHGDMSQQLHVMPALAPLSDTTQSRERRARSYLAANCAQCHQPNGTAHAQWDARASTPLSQAGLINGSLLTQGDSAQNRVIVPGSPDRSMLLKRMATLGEGHMPPLGTSLVDQEAVQLISQWISQDLAGYQTFSQWQQQHFGSTTAPNARADADPDNDGANNELEYVVRTNPKAAGDAWGVALDAENNQLRVLQPANRAIEAQSVDRLGQHGLWAPINVPENKPHYPAAAREVTIPLPTDSQSRYFRVRIHEP